MKKSTVGFGASLLMAGIILAGCGSGSAETDSAADSGATEIKVGTGNEALPYAYLDENGEYDGYDVAVVKPAFPNCVTRMAVNLDISGF